MSNRIMVDNLPFYLLHQRQADAELKNDGMGALEKPFIYLHLIDIRRIALFCLHVTRIWCTHMFITTQWICSAFDISHTGPKCNATMWNLKIHIASSENVLHALLQLQLNTVRVTVCMCNLNGCAHWVNPFFNPVQRNQFNFIPNFFSKFLETHACTRPA